MANVALDGISTRPGQSTLLQMMRAVCYFRGTGVLCHCKMRILCKAPLKASIASRHSYSAVLLGLFSSPQHLDTMRDDEIGLSLRACQKLWHHISCAWHFIGSTCVWPRVAHKQYGGTCWPSWGCKQRNNKIPEHQLWLRMRFGRLLCGSLFSSILFLYIDT